MLDQISPLTSLRNALSSGETNVAEIAEYTLAQANTNASKNTYLSLDRKAVQDEAEMLSKSLPNPRFRPSLFGIPISLKDCFDLAGTVTTCGSRFYAEHNKPADHDSAMAHVLLSAGALITGKTHLQPLAYGITGQNPDYGDCLQPRDATLLTGGSSSGAAASIQEGSALAAIGTDTGGSIRVPAALCGLVGFRTSHAVGYGHGPWRYSEKGLWEGACHLSQTFDTAGFLLRDPRDAAPLAKALFGIPLAGAPPAPRIGFLHEAALTDATPDVLNCYAKWRKQMAPAAAFLEEFHPAFWSEAPEIFAGIQSSEAAALHAGHFDRFEPSIAKRLHGGAAFTPADIELFRERLEIFRSQMKLLFRQFDLLMLPCAPVSRLVATEDQSDTRAAILRYTAPFSLAGAPVVSLPGEMIGAPFGTGVQLAAAPGKDAALLAFVAKLADSVLDMELDSAMDTRMEAKR